MKILTRTALTSSAVIVLSLGLSSCGSLFETVDDAPSASSSPSSSSSGPAVEGENTVDVFTLSVGDCILEPSDASAAGYSDISTVPCSEPHDAEVYFSSMFPEGNYPGDDFVNTTAGETCSEQFTVFTGVDYDSETTLDFWYFTPTQQTWEGIDDREILCMVYSLNEESLTGSVAGLGVKEESTQE